MTLLKNFTGLVVLTTLLFSCKKEMSIEDIKSPIVIDASWQFTESGKTFMGKIDTAYMIEATGFNIITLQGTTSDGITGQIVLEVAGETVGTGTYNDGNSYFLYAENGAAVYNSMTGGGTNFSITITTLDSVSITGTFSGTVKGADGADKTIVDGKFSAPFSKADLKIIQPNPDNDDYFQMGAKWEYQNTQDANDKVVITNISDTIINVNGSLYTYAVLENDRTGQHRYFRKEGNNFYEYSLATLGGNINPQELDLLILKQDGVDGESWDSDTYSFSISGIPALNAKITTTIEAKDYSAVLDGFKYENLLQVKQQLYVDIGGGIFEPSPDDVLTTIYSRGIGIVQYYDLTLDGLYILKSYTF